MNALHPLGQLIQSIEDSKGWTVREIGRRTEQASKSLTHTYIGRLKRDPIRSVTYDMVQSLAIGLNVPERIVAAAALESMGVHDIGTAETGAAVAIARDPDLSERDRRILLAVVREMQSERTNEEHPGERSAPAGRRPAAVGGSAVADPAESDGISTAIGRRPRQEDYDRAAMTGTSELDRLDREAADRGEESQDHDGEDPA